MHISVQSAECQQTAHTHATSTRKPNISHTLRLLVSASLLFPCPTARITATLISNITD